MLWKLLSAAKLTLFITEGKVDDPFPTTQCFLIEGFSSPFCLDRDSKGGEVIIFLEKIYLVEYWIHIIPPRILKELS